MGKTREITLFQEKGTFSIFKKLPRKKQEKQTEEYDFSGVAVLRKLLSNEKARILHTIKTQSPSSIYDLAKKLGRNFKSVSDDVRILEKFGFIELIDENVNGRQRKKPIITTDMITINFRI